MSSLHKGTNGIFKIRTTYDSNVCYFVYNQPSLFVPLEWMKFQKWLIYGKRRRHTHEGVSRMLGFHRISGYAIFKYVWNTRTQEQLWFYWYIFVVFKVAQQPATYASTSNLVRDCPFLNGK